MLVNSSEYVCALMSMLFVGFALGASISSFIFATEKK